MVKHKYSRYDNDRAGRRAHRGAALLYAIAVMVIVTLIVGGSFAFMVANVAVNESTRGLNRALYVAESAADWKMNEMAHVLPPGVNSGPPGYKTFANFSPTYGDWSGFTPLIVPPVPYALPASDFAIPNNTAAADTASMQPQDMRGAVRVYIDDGNHANGWQPGQNFDMLAFGYDQNSGNWRYLELEGAATGLTDRFSLFGTSSLSFTGSIPVALETPGIGTNGGLSAQTIPSMDATKFPGVRIGTSSANSVQPGLSTWANSYDVARVPDGYAWPSIGTIVWYSTGQPLANIAPASNSQIVYGSQPDTNSPFVWKTFATTPTKLTNAEFQSSSTLTGKRMIRLIMTAGQPNLFRFSDINMGDNDVLILDMNPPSAGSTTSPMRILLDGGTNNSMRITNLAYLVITPSGPPPDPNFPTNGFMWLNNIPGSTLTYDPTLAAQFVAVAPGGDSTHNYNITGEWRGLVYSPGVLGDTVNVGADIVVHSVSTGTKLNCLIGRNVTLDTTKGTITQARSGDIEGIGSGTYKKDDPQRFVLYYRLTTKYRDMASSSVWVTYKPRQTYGQMPLQ